MLKVVLIETNQETALTSPLSWKVQLLAGTMDNLGLAQQANTVQTVQAEVSQSIVNLLRTP